MSKLRVHCFSISLDGYGAGPRQTLENPIGEGGMAMHDWLFSTKAFNQAHGGAEDGETGIDNDFVLRSLENAGAWILGRNMFGPVRGDWGDSDWRGWWGDNPPYHTDVIVLTNYPKESLAMEGGATFHFETGGIETALERAKASANGKDIRLGGGVSTIRQYLLAGLVDEMHLAISPVLLGAGEHLLAGIDLPKLGYRCVEFTPGQNVTHVVIGRASGG